MAAAPGDPATAAADGFARSTRRRTRSSFANPASSTNDAIRRGPHALGETMWPNPLATMCLLLASVFATSSPLAGGVTGSSAPENRSTGLSLATGCAKSAGMRPRGHTLHTAMHVVGNTARLQAGKRGRGEVRRDARHVLGAGDRKMQRGVQLLGRVGARRLRRGEQRPVVAGGGEPQHFRQQARRIPAYREAAAAARARRRTSGCTGEIRRCADRRRRYRDPRGPATRRSWSAWRRDPDGVSCTRATRRTRGAPRRTSPGACARHRAC